MKRLSQVIWPMAAILALLWLANGLLARPETLTNDSKAYAKLEEPGQPTPVLGAPTLAVRPSLQAKVGDLVALPSIAPVVRKAKSAVVNITAEKISLSPKKSRRISQEENPQNPWLPDNYDDLFIPPQAGEEPFLQDPGGEEGEPEEEEPKNSPTWPDQAEKNPAPNQRPNEAPNPPNLEFDPPQAKKRTFREHIQASGFIFDQEGHVITNNHVVEGAFDIMVKLDDGEEIEATVVGRDPKTDLALLKLAKPGPYPYLALGDSDQVQIGDWVLAIGNPFGLSRTVTKGIVSARGRAIGAGPYDNFLQTDASINPGNSGGPLLTLDGEVVGVNAMIFAGGTGIGFAIPSNMVKKIVTVLKEDGYVERGFIGVVAQPITADLALAFGLKSQDGALVGEALEDSPASLAGLKPGDVIVEFAGQPIKEIDQLATLTAESVVGQETPISIIRDQNKLTLTLTVARLDDAIPDNGGFLGGPVMDLGLTLREITPSAAEKLGLDSDDGLLVEQTLEKSPAREAGLEIKDIILEVDRKPVNNLKDYNGALRSHPRGEPILLWVKRGQHSLYRSIKLLDLPQTP
ncbi:MAG: trypsin-like peptidase domain-containing protein [Deltaproteobacteria bacterium]|jgi:serine protease Do|nr:trypsin-like peptidase domain-containing protein [Deltaproteobacteria bacterium]